MCVSTCACRHAYIYLPARHAKAQGARSVRRGRGALLRAEDGLANRTPCQQVGEGTIGGGGGGKQQQLCPGAGALHRHSVAMSVADARLEVHSFVFCYRCAVMTGCGFVWQHDVYSKCRRSVCLHTAEGARTIFLAKQVTNACACFNCVTKCVVHNRNQIGCGCECVPLL